MNTEEAGGGLVGSGGRVAEAEAEAEAEAGSGRVRFGFGTVLAVVGCLHHIVLHATVVTRVSTSRAGIHAPGDARACRNQTGAVVERQLTSLQPFTPTIHTNPFHQTVHQTVHQTDQPTNRYLSAPHTSSFQRRRSRALAPHHLE